MYEHCGDGKQIQKDIHCKSQDMSKIMWQRLIFNPVFDKDGEYEEVIGTVVDITEQKEREQSYEEQLRLKKMLAKGSLAMASYNLTKNVVTESESLRKDLAELMQNVSADGLLKRIREDTLNEGEESRFLPVQDCKTILKAYENGTTHIEIRHHLKGDSRWMQSTFDMIVNPYTGDVEAISILRDISDTVRAELVVNQLLAVDYEAIMTIDVRTGTATPFRKGMQIV